MAFSGSLLPGPPLQQEESVLTDIHVVRGRWVKLRWAQTTVRQIKGRDHQNVIAELEEATVLLCAS